MCMYVCVCLRAYARLCTCACERIGHNKKTRVRALDISTVKSAVLFAKIVALDQNLSDRPRSERLRLGMASCK
jgi:hypothetical protein